MPKRSASRLAWVLVGILVLVWLAPKIVAHSPVLGWFIAAATEDLNGDVSIGSASLGWFSAPRVTNLEIRSEDGQQVLEIPEVAGERSLLGLLTNSSKLGRFRLLKPTFHIVLRDDGSNLEDVLANYLAPKSEPPAAVDVAVEILDGSVFVVDPKTQRTWQIEKFKLNLAAPADQARPVTVEAAGAVNDPAGPARFDVSATLVRDAAPGQADGPSTPPEPSELKLQTEALPLEMAGPLLARFAPGLQVTGRLTSSLACSFRGTGSPAEANVEGRLSAERLVLAAPVLGTDRVGLARLDVDCKLEWRKDRLEIGRLVAQSDLGDISATGSLDLGDEATANFLAALPQQTYELTGRIDLAKLAAVLPGTLRIREGTRVTSGRLEVALASQPGRYGMAWQGRIEATDLAAANRGRQWSWERPILMRLSARETSQGPVLENLSWESDFLSLDVSGNADRLSAAADFDMNQLASRLSGFVDVGELRFAGRGQANVHWVRADGQQFRTNGDFEVRDFELSIPQRPSWKEEKLIATFTAGGKTDFTAATQVDAAVVELNAGSDQLKAQLMQPVRGFRNGGTWTVEVNSRGQIARWLPRLSPWIAMNDWTASGTYDLAVLATASSTALNVSRSRLAVAELHVSGPGVNVAEPTVELALAGGWDGRRRRLDLQSADLKTEKLQALAEELVFSLSDEGRADLTGTLRCRGDLENVQKWFVDPAEPHPWMLQGTFFVGAGFRQTGGTITANFNSTVDELVATHLSGEEFRETQIRFAGKGSFDNATRTFRVATAELTSGALGASVAGQLAMAETAATLKVDGQLNYDMEKISQLLKSRTDAGLYLSGRGTAPFSYQGPLDPAVAEGRAAIGWDWGDLYGVRVGPGRLDASLGRGVLRVRPVSVDVSEGRLHLAPEVRFADQSIQLYVPSGPLVDRVRINPQMCGHLLQYIAPVLAGVATADGTFSIEVEGCRIPLDDPAAGEMAGWMTVHSVEIGPGPVIRELATLLGRQKAAKLTRESKIEFRLVDGRVYHRGLEMVFPDVTVRTYGSVGLDKSLAIMAEMPVPPKWRTGGLLGSALRDQTIKLPIAGTLDKPKIDQAVFDQIRDQFLRKAAENVVEDGLYRGLDRLFNRPR